MQSAIIEDKNLAKSAEMLVDCFDVGFEKASLVNCETNLLRRQAAESPNHNPSHRSALATKGGQPASLAFLPS